MTITKEMGIMEVVSQYPETVEVFVNAGMGCLGCAAARTRCRRSWHRYR